MIEIRLTIKQFEKKVPKDKKKIGGQENSEMFIKWVDSLCFLLTEVCLIVWFID